MLYLIGSFDGCRATDSAILALSKSRKPGHIIGKWHFVSRKRFELVKKSVMKLLKRTYQAHACFLVI